MTTLIECPGCTRHVRADDGRCPFCGRPSTTVAPARVLALVLPLTLMACTGGDGPTPEAKPAATKPAPVDPPKPVPPAPDDAGADPTQPSQPADGGAVVDEPPVPDDHRIMVTKYGGPPVMDDAGLVPIAEPEPVTENARQPRKYGAPPRPAKKYGAPPKPIDDEPL